jgi:hypothetical protein
MVVEVKEEVREERVVEMRFDEDEYTSWRLFAKDTDGDGYADFVQIEKSKYGNHVKTVVNIYAEADGGFRFEVYSVRQNWGGTESDELLKLYFNDYAETPFFMWFNEIKDIKSVRDIIRYVRDIAEYIHGLADMIIM